MKTMLALVIQSGILPLSRKGFMNAKKTRKIVTFEPEPDVEAMLDTAKKGGLTIGEVMNESLRAHGKKAIAELAMERTRQLKKLIMGSFKAARRPADESEQVVAQAA